MRFQALRGTSDLLADDVKRWSLLEHRVRRLASVYGYHEIRTPLIEDAGLFLRSVGDTTDIVQKELFRFTDRGGHDITLRPEATAAVVRAYLEHSLQKTEGFTKLFYLGPMFRAERPQAGRFRQFHQYGVEAIGSASPWADSEVIAFCLHVLRACGLEELSVWLSSMGCRADQQRSSDALRQHLHPKRGKLCKDCQARWERNVFRVLDCKHATCQQLARPDGASPFLLCAACTEHFQQVKHGLATAGVAFDDSRIFARGIDYYTRTVFEVRARGLGAQDAVAAGGRYDHLVEELGGPPVGAVGFAAGIERVLLAMDAAAKGQAASPAIRRGIYVAVTDGTLFAQGFKLVQQLRERGIGASLDFDGKSLKAQLREADKAGCRLVAILGAQEAARRAMSVKDLEQGGAQHTVGFDDFPDHVASRLKATTCH